MSPIGGGEETEDIESWFGFPSNFFHVLVEEEVRVEGHPKDLGVPFQGERGAVQRDSWMEVGLPELGGEEGNC